MVSQVKSGVSICCNAPVWYVHETQELKCADCTDSCGMLEPLPDYPEVYYAQRAEDHANLLAEVATYD